MLDVHNKLIIITILQSLLSQNISFKGPRTFWVLETYSPESKILDTRPLEYKGFDAIFTTERINNFTKFDHKFVGQKNILDQYSGVDLI
jgi:hypothetical protein